MTDDKSTMTHMFHRPTPLGNGLLTILPTPTVGLRLGRGDLAVAPGGKVRRPCPSERSGDHSPVVTLPKSEICPVGRGRKSYRGGPRDPTGRHLLLTKSLVY